MPDTQFWVQDALRREDRLTRLAAKLQASPQGVLLQQAVQGVSGLLEGNGKKGEPPVSIGDALTLVAQQLGYTAHVSISPQTGLARA